MSNNNSIANYALTPDLMDTTKALYASTAKALASTCDLISTFNDNKMKEMKVTAKANAEVKVAKSLVKSKLTVNALTKEVADKDIEDVKATIKTAMDSW